MNRLSAKVKEYFSKQGTVSTWWNPETGTHSFHFSREIQILEKFLCINPNWRVLDVGTGRGRFAIWAARHGCEVKAIDLNTEMLSIAENNAKNCDVSNKIEFEYGDAGDMSGYNSEFDIVFCMQTLDHIPEAEKAIRGMIDKIVPGGLFIFTFVSDHCIYWITQEIKAKIKKPIQKIATAYPVDWMFKTIENAGVKIEKTYGIGLLYPVYPKFVPFLPLLVCKLENRLKPYYTGNLVNRCTHILCIARKVL
jgi:2-polyprenyl-3-methyl-5-hydroxy-6-metoxy-1,4-benzoquinol methylase